MGLIEKNFFDGLVFHRIIEGFMIQGGCPEGTGMGGSGTNITGEFARAAKTSGIISLLRQDILMKTSFCMLLLKVITTRQSF